MRSTVLMLAVTVLAAGSRAETRPPVEGALVLPVREVTVFKDGHAFLLHSGRLPVGRDGDIRLDYLPTPVMGTFWPYSADRSVKLSSVTGSSTVGIKERKALTVAELVEANAGASATIVTTDKQTFAGEIIETPRLPLEIPTSAGLDAAQGQFLYDSRTGRYVPERAAPKSDPPQTLLFKSAEGAAAIPLSSVKMVTFKGPYRRTIRTEELRHRLTLRMDWPKGRAADTANIGLVYLQKGLRWTPSYKIEIDGKGKAAVKLQATLLNELVDLNDVTANLVIGVPSFTFKASTDPISLQEAFPTLSKFFQDSSETGFAFSNAIMGQGGFGGGGFGGGVGGGGGRGGPRVEDEAEEATDGEQGQPAPDRTEDLYVFTIRHLTVKKGESVAVPVAEYSLSYSDVYVCEIPFARPPEIRDSSNRQQEAELARLLYAPKVQHKLRIENRARAPLTTAPALVVKDDRVVAQGMIPYTPIGGTSDLTVTNSGEIRVRKTDETRKPQDADDSHRRDFVSTLGVTSYLDQNAVLEVIRYVPGRVDKATPRAEIRLIHPYDEDGPFYRSGDYPYWWYWYDWPYWWETNNGFTRILWKIGLEPGQSTDLTYEWHYFWN